MLVTAGCYREVPLQTANPSPATRITAQVTDSGVVAMANLIGPAAEEVEGVVVATTPEAMQLSLLRVDQRGGISTTWNREPITFPRFALTRARVKQLDRKRSFLTAAGIVVGAVAAAEAFKGLGADEPTDGTPTPAQIRLIPLLLRHR